MTILTLYKDIARKYPDNTAVIYNGRSLTYREVDELSTLIAQSIIAHGHKKGDVAGVLVPRCEYMVIAALAVVKAGMIFMPMDSKHPKERLEYMLEDSRASLLVTLEGMMMSTGIDTSSASYDTIILPETDNITGLYQWSPMSAELPEVVPTDIFTIIYTSGTTGQPKGVLIPHSSPLSLFSFMRKEFHLSENDIFGEYVSYGFDACINDIFCCLTTGTTILIIPEEIKLNLKSMSRYLIDNKATFLDLPTAVIMRFLHDCPQGSLRCIISGGEKFMPLNPNYTSCDIYNLYGPSEAFVFSTYYKIQNDETDIPIGRPVTGNRIDILLEDGTPARTGEIGEIMITGPQVGIGYINHPDLTAQKFTRNPHVEGPENRMYHTGDLGYIREDGNIMIVGRSDSQVKIRGNRLELKEVEMAVRQYPGVVDATVDVKKSPSGQSMLVAYVVGDGVIDGGELRQFVAEHKPEYMVPSFVEQLESLPLTINGKIDHSKLPLPDFEAGMEYVAPRNELEEKICNAFSKATGIEHIGIDHDIVELGGDSLTIMRLLEICSDVPSLTASLLITEGTARKIAKVLKECYSNVRKIVKQADYPIYGLQNDLYEFYVNTPGNKILHVEHGIRMSMEVDEERLRRAVITTVNTHPALKVRFRKNADGEPRMIRNDEEEVLVDICHARESEIKEISEGLIRYFDLAEEPCYRIKIVVTEEHKYLLFDLHHFVADGASMGIFLNNINRTYMGEPLTNELWTAFEMALHEKEMTGSEAYEVGREWYEDTFSKLTCDILPEGDLEADGDPVSRDKLIYPLHITKTELEEKCKELKTTATILADVVFAYNLGRYTHQQEAVFVTISEGRNMIENQNTVGCFAKCEPVYCKWDDNTELSQMLEEMKSMRYKCMVYSAFPFSRLSTSQRLMNKMIFVNQIYLEELKEFCGHEASEFRFNGEEMYFGISTELYADKSDDSLYLRLLYRGSRYSEAFMRQYGKDFEDTLSSVLHRKSLH